MEEDKRRCGIVRDSLGGTEDRCVSSCAAMPDDRCTVTTIRHNGRVNRRHRAASDPTWQDAAIAAANRFRHLDGASRDRLIGQAEDFDRSRYWEGLDGLEVTPAKRGHVAAHASLLTLNIGLGMLSDVTSILLAPHSSMRTTQHRIGGSIVSEGEACVLGQALLHGPVRLSWSQVSAESSVVAGTSVLLHEFAHKIDMADGYSDGIPPIDNRRRSRDFEATAEHVLVRLQSGAISPPLRRYAATNRTELFAVATEGFFLRSSELATHYPDLHEALKGFYQQDPTTVRS